MKKRVLFSLLAIFLAGLGLGGVSLAATTPDCTGIDPDENEASLTIGENTYYCSLSDAFGAAQDGGTVTLLDNISLSNNVVVNNRITLDLNGKSINTNYRIVIKNEVTVTGNGVINANGNYGIMVYAGGGKLIINGGTRNGGSDNYYIISSYGWVTINTGMFNGNYSVVNHFTYSESYDVYKTDGILEINGGIFDSYADVDSEGNCESATIMAGSETIINGGIFSANGGKCVVGDWDNGYYYNAGGNLVAGHPHTFKIKGGIFDKDPGNLLDEGYVVTEIGGKFVVSFNPVAKIGGSGYSTLTGAIAAATEGQIIEILKSGDYTLPTNISVANLTIKGATAGVKFSHATTTNQIISEIAGPVTFENVEFVLTNSNNTTPHYVKVTNGSAEGVITFKDCIISGLLFGYGTMTFNNCVFEQDKYAYNMWTWRGDITYNNCIFHNSYSSYFINVYHWLTDPLQQRTININTASFTTENQGVGAKVKAAVNIKEAENSGNTSVALQFVVNLNNITTNGTFLTTGWGGSAKYQVDDLLGENGKIDGVDGGTPSYGTDEGGDVTVKLDGNQVYTTPKKGVSQWIVTFDGTNTGVVNDGGKAVKPADPAAQGCKTFVEWQLNGVAYDFNSVVTGNLALTSKWSTSSCGGGGGSSSSSSSSSNKTGDNNTGATAESGTIADTGANTSAVDPQGVAANGYTNEMNEAYEFAYANGITTMKSIDEAEMLDGLTRIAMAKMLSQYAINVLGKSPADVEVPNFTDVSADLDAEYANGVSLAYKLGIMGINMPDNKFLPYETVTRAQFGTALSRLLFGIEDGEDAYYATHLAKLKEAGIITNDDPTLEELRGYVMLMLMRSSKGNNTVNNSTEGTVSNENTNKPENETNVQEQEVEKYFTEAYRRGQIYGRIGDLQRLLQYLGYYNGEINNTFDNNTINAVFDFQIAMGILAADDTSTSRGNVGPKTREVLNQKWAEYKASK